MKRNIIRIICLFQVVLLLSGLFAFDVFAIPASEVTTDVGEKPVIRGDVNGDGKVDPTDVVKLSQFFAGYNYDTGEEAFKVAPGADYDNDGEITLADLAKLRQGFADGIFPDYCKHQNVTEVAAKAATCTATGNDAYKTCDDCQAILNAEGEEIDEIPEIAIDPENHPAQTVGIPANWNAEKKAYVATCPCGVKLVDYFLYKADSNTTGMTGADAEPIIDPDGTAFIRFTRKDDFEGKAITIHFIRSGSQVTGQYMLVKYRAPAGEESASRFLNSFGGTAQSEKNSGTGNIDKLGTNGVIYDGLISNGEWHYAVIDLATLAAANAENTEFKANNDGSYSVKYIRTSVHVADGGYFDIAFVGFADHVEALNEYVSEVYCEHENIKEIPAKEATCTEEGNEAYKVCPDCQTMLDANGVKIDAIPKIAIDPENHVLKNAGAPENWNAESNAYVAECDCGTEFVDYFLYKSDSGIYCENTGDATKNSDFYLIQSGTQVTGQYMLVKYKAPVGSASVSLLNGYGGTVGSTRNTAGGLKVDYLGALYSDLVSDGEWHYAIIDLAALAQAVRDSASYDNTEFNANGDGSYSVKYVRASVKINSGEWFEIAFVGFADHIEALEEYVSNDCEHVGATEVAAKDATCTAEGNAEYKICPDCHTLWDAEGEEIDAIPTIAKVDHDIIEHAALSATCTANGSEAYSECRVCHQLWNEEGDEIDAIPTIGKTDHDIIEHAALGATCTATGNEEYSECAACGQLWNAEGEEINEIPEIAIDPENHVLKNAGAPENWNAERNAYVAECACGTEFVDYFLYKADSDTTKQEYASAQHGEDPDGTSYIRYTKTDDNKNAINLYLIYGGTQLTGQYMLVKYRAPAVDGSAIRFLNSFAGTVKSGNDTGKGNGDGLGVIYEGLTSNGEWHYAVIDLETLASNNSSTHFIANDDESYSVKYIRTSVHIADAADGGYFDIAFVGFADHVEALNEYVSEVYCEHENIKEIPAKEATCTEEGNEAYKVCPDCQTMLDANGVKIDAIPKIAIDPENHVLKNAGAPENWNEEKNAYVVKCTCGVDIVDYFLYNEDSNTTGMSYASAQPGEDPDGTSYIRYTKTDDSKTAITLHLIRYGDQVTGQYMLVKYRAPAVDGSAIRFLNSFAGTVKSGNDTGKGNGDGLGVMYEGLTSNGEWQYVIIDLAALASNNSSTHFIANDDGSYSVKYVRTSVHVADAADGGYFDVAFVGFADHVEALEQYVSVSTNVGAN